MSSLEPQNKYPNLGPDLLKDYEEKKLRSFVMSRLIGGLLLIVLTGASVYEVTSRGTFHVLAFEAGLMASILLVSLLLGVSVVLFSVSWRYAEAQLVRGETRPHLRHVFGFGIASLVVAVLLGSIGNNLPADAVRALLITTMVFWNFAGCSILGYLAKFHAAGKFLN